MAGCLLPEIAVPPWYGEFIGVAYRYYDLRMNVVPLFSERPPAAKLWDDACRWWVEPTIRIRFIEDGKRYWFAAGAESSRPDSNVFLYKSLHRSENYERFKKGHGGEAYLRLGVYSKKDISNAKDDDICDCTHEKQDHDEEDAACLYEDCTCAKFASFQVRLLKKKKTVTDIRFLSAESARDDPLAWNCLNANRPG